jgi:hypothetical protein
MMHEKLLTHFRNNTCKFDGEKKKSELLLLLLMMMISDTT